MSQSLHFTNDRFGLQINFFIIPSLDGKAFKNQFLIICVFLKRGSNPPFIFIVLPIIIPFSLANMYWTANDVDTCIWLRIWTTELNYMCLYYCCIIQIWLWVLSIPLSTLLPSYDRNNVILALWAIVRSKGDKKK